MTKFNKVLNRPQPPVPAERVTERIKTIPIYVEHLTLNEIRSAIKELKNGKAPGNDNITSELLRADPETSSKQIYNMLTKIWSYKLT